MAEEAEKSAVATRLRRMPGIGPVTAMAIETFAPAMANFRRGRDFAGTAPTFHRRQTEIGAPHRKWDSATSGDC